MGVITAHRYWNMERGSGGFDIPTHPAHRDRADCAQCLEQLQRGNENGNWLALHCATSDLV